MDNIIEKIRKEQKRIMMRIECLDGGGDETCIARIHMFKIIADLNAMLICEECGKKVDDHDLGKIICPL